MKIVNENPQLAELLQCGTRHSSDNALVTNCSEEFLKYAEKSLNDTAGEIVPCVIKLKSNTETKLEKVFEKFSDSARPILARDFVTSLIMLRIMQKLNLKSFNKSYTTDMLTQGLSAYLKGDAEKVKEFHMISPIPYEISMAVRNIGRIELVFMLKDIKNAHIQHIINDYIGSREPYCVKIFTNKDMLASYLTSNGQYIQSPHDYQSYDFAKICENSTTKTK